MHESFSPSPSEEEQPPREEQAGQAESANPLEASPGSADDEIVVARAAGTLSSEPDTDGADILQDTQDNQDTQGAPEWPPVAVPTAAAEQFEPVPWTFRQTLLGTLLTLGPWLIFAIGTQLAQVGAKQPAHPQKLSPGVDLATAIVVFIFSSALEAIFLIAPLFYAARTAPSGLSGVARLRSMLAALGMRPVGLLPAARATGVAIVVILGASVAYDNLRQALHLPLKTNADVLLEQAKYEPYTVIATLLVAVLVAPICEETFFRGFVFPGLARGMSIWGAVVVSALLFGVAHADLGSFVVLAVIGIVLAVVRWQTRSLWPGVVVHTLNNAIALVSILVLLPH